ncbi:MAG: hypothetical protein Q7J27_04325 [Syntrophales bacterium]|nr:hypothetical protein [Syntrophales bacterium]
MVDINLIISAALSSIKTATEITKFFRENKMSIEKAEIKFKLSDLVSTLADAKIQIVDVQEALQEKDKRIAELEEAFQSKDKLVRPPYYDAYYKIDEKGEPIGIPLCLSCWENRHKQCQLVLSSKKQHVHVCTACDQEYLYRKTPDI